MLGFAVAAFFELTQGKDVFEQVKAYPLLTITTFVIFTTASWIPFLQGQSYNVKSGPFTPAVSGSTSHHALLQRIWLLKKLTATCYAVHAMQPSSLADTTMVCSWSCRHVAQWHVRSWSQYSHSGCCLR
jgi:hypothetical protein